MTAYWTVAQQKGGVGKTTSVFSLAAIACSRGYRVLVVDLDPQGGISSLLGSNPEVVESGAYSLLNQAVATINDVVVSTEINHLDLIPASRALAASDRQWAVFPGSTWYLRQVLRESMINYDLVLIDSPNYTSTLLMSALLAADTIILPTQTDILSLQAVAGTLRLIDLLRSEAEWTGHEIILPTFFDSRTRASGDGMHWLSERYGGNLYKAGIPLDSKFTEAHRLGLPLPMMDGRSRGAQAYSKLFLKLIRDYTDKKTSMKRRQRPSGVMV